MVTGPCRRGWRVCPGDRGVDQLAGRPHDEPAQAKVVPSARAFTQLCPVCAFTHERASSLADGMGADRCERLPCPSPPRTPGVELSGGHSLSSPAGLPGARSRSGDGLRPRRAGDDAAAADDVQSIRLADERLDGGSCVKDREIAHAARSGAVIGRAEHAGRAFRNTVSISSGRPGCAACAIGSAISSGSACPNG